MKRRIILWTALAAFASLSAPAEEWTFGKLRTWSRNNLSTVKELDGNAFEVRHTGGQDWCVTGSGCPRIAVKPGDTFRFSCTSEKLPDAEDGPGFNLSVIAYDAKGEAINWVYAPTRGQPGDALKGEFAIVPGVATIVPRVVGDGAFGARIRDLKIERTGNLLAAGQSAAASDASFGNAALKGTVFADGSGFAVTDARTGRTWTPFTGRSMARTLLTALATRPDGSVSAEFVDFMTLRKFGATFAADPAKPEILVTVSGSGPMKEELAYPAPFASRKGDRLVVPMNEGISFPADDAKDLPGKLIAYGGHGLCMAFFGVQDDATGAGWMGIFETPDDAAMKKSTDAAAGLSTMGPVWHDQKKAFGYARRFRYVFFDKGGHVAMAKRYRAHAKAIGLFKPFSEKVRERPLVDRLLGAPNVWCWEGGKVAVAQKLKDAGIDRFLWSAGGSADEVKALAAMPDVLVSRYDVYQDIYHPEQLEKLGWKKGCNTEAWPHDVVWNGPSSNEWRHAWPVKAKDGTWTYCAMMCDATAPKYERRNVTEELKTKPYNTRFIDTTVAAPWQTCWNPAHPMTRSDSRHWKMELLRILGDEFGLVVGSETGHDASVPYCDYYEGMLSLGPYRVPDSGRNIPQIWTNVPPRVAKYQVGEAYRLPLWELVYHECVCAHWYWGDYNNKLPDIWWKRDLFNRLYGTMGMYIFNNRQWAADKDRFVRSYNLTSPVARKTGYSEMTDHRILTPDRSVQQTVFANGVTVTANFGDAPFTLPGGTVVAPRDSVVTGL